MVVKEISYAVYFVSLRTRNPVVRIEPRGQREKTSRSLWPVRRGASESRRGEGNEPPAVYQGCHYVARFRGETAGPRWPLRRFQGTAWGIFPHRCARSGRGALLGGTLSGGRAWSRGGTPDLGNAAVNTEGGEQARN